MKPECSKTAEEESKDDTNMDYEKIKELEKINDKFGALQN